MRTCSPVKKQFSKKKIKILMIIIQIFNLQMINICPPIELSSLPLRRQVKYCEKKSQLWYEFNFEFADQQTNGRGVPSRFRIVLQVQFLWCF